MTPECYEPTAVAAIRSWFGETGRAVYACGPLLPAISKEKETTRASAHERRRVGGSASDEIEEFLDAALKASGPQSVLYVRARAVRPASPSRAFRIPCYN